MDGNTKILALVGKGGVGKTTLCAAFVRILSEKYPKARILAIDADPAVGLSTALGVTVKETLDDLRREIIEKAAAGAGKEAVEMLGEVRFRIFDALVETDRFAFLAIGRPEGAGCYCAVNAYLKEVIGMISKDFDFVVIDGEAGIEQVNRRVMENVTHLFLVSDGSKKGIQVIKSLRQVADELVSYEKLGVIINRVEDPELIMNIICEKAREGSGATDLGCKEKVGEGSGATDLSHKEKVGEGVSHVEIEGMEVLGVIPSDPAHAKNEILGKDVFELPKDSAVLVGASDALEKMMKEA